MELKLGDTITQEMLDAVKLVADDLETAKGQLKALETQIETDAEAFEAKVKTEAQKIAAGMKKEKGAIGADVHAIVNDIKAELGSFAHHVNWQALFEKHRL